MVRNVEILNISWISPIGSVNRLDEGCAKKKRIKGDYKDHGLRKWNSGSPLAEMGNMGKELAGEMELRLAHIKLKMPSRHPSGDGPGGSYL